jgi:hypothetical protein
MRISDCGLENKSVLFNPQPEIRIPQLRRGARVVELAALEMLCGGNSTVGSNPTLSAFVK